VPPGGIWARPRADAGPVPYRLAAKPLGPPAAGGTGRGGGPPPGTSRRCVVVAVLPSRMESIEYRTGDATAPIGTGPMVIAHGCNDAGAWGAGFVLAVSRRWKAPERAFRAWHKARAENDFGLGAVQLVEVARGLWVANMITQRGIRSAKNPVPLQPDALKTCLATLATWAAEHHASVHMPRIGAGLAGGRWDEIEPMILHAFAASAEAVVVYDLVAARSPE
jgi:O-acetyl-ADP-ribose deacetylase (regulator of RNase III)